MSKVKLKYEILISGIYPIEGEFEKNGFKMISNEIDKNLVDIVFKAGTIYFSPYIGFCCYPDKEDMPVYLTFQKESIVEIDYSDTKEYDIAFTNEQLKHMNLFEEIEDLEKVMVLEVNNDIKFPVKMVKVYDSKDNFVTVLADFMKPNVSGLLGTDQATIDEILKRQGNRLSSGISYEKIVELKNNNRFFDNALSIYYSSFAVSDEKVGFVLLVTALEALLARSTYSKPETCANCGQPKYGIRASVSENVSLLLMDKDDSIKREIKRFYDKRSKFLHVGERDITKQNEQDMQEYVRKVLLMYWYISMCKDTYEHQTIINEIQSTGYKTEIMYQTFLTSLSNISFQEKRNKMIKDILMRIAMKQ